MEIYSVTDIFYAFYVSSLIYCYTDIMYLYYKLSEFCLLAIKKSATKLHFFFLV